MADETLKFKVSLDTTDFKTAINGLEQELAKAGEAGKKAFDSAIKPKYVTTVEFGADTSEVEIALQLTSNLEQKIARERAKRQRQLEKDEADALKQRERDEKRLASERAKESKALEAAIKKIQQEQAKLNQQEADRLNRQREIRNNWGKVLGDFKEYSSIQKGSLNQLSSELAFQKEKLNNLVRGTAEYKAQLAIVQQLQNQKQIQLLGPQGVQAEAFGALAEGFSKAVFIGQQLVQVVGGITSAFNTLFEASAKLQSIQLTFQSIGIGASGANTALQESQRIALGLGVEINTVRDAYAKLSPVILATGGNLGNVSAVTEALSSRFVAFGKSAEESRRIMNGVIQAFGKGKLQAEELTQQIGEADPAFKTDLAGAIGVTVAKLEEMVKNGEVNSAMLMKTLPLLGKSAELYGRLGQSALSAVNALREGNAVLPQVQAQIANLNQLNLERLAQAFQPALIAILEIQAAFTDLMTSFMQGAAFDFLVEVFNNMAQTISVVVQAIAYLADGILLFLNVAFSIIDWADQFFPISEALAVAILAIGTALAGIGIQAAIAQFTAFTGAISAITGPMAAFLGSLFTANGAIALFVKGMVAKTGVTYKDIIANGLLATSLQAVWTGFINTAKQIALFIARMVAQIAVVGLSALANFSLAGSLTAVAAAGAAVLAVLAPFVLPLLAIAGVVVAVKYAWDQHNKSTGEAKKQIENTDKAIEAMNKDVEQAGGAVNVMADAQDRASKAGLSLAAYNQKVSNTTEAINESAGKYNAALDKNIAALQRKVAASDGSKKSDEENVKVGKALISNIDGQIASYNQKIASYKAVEEAGGKLTDEERKQYETLKQTVAALEQKRGGLLDLVPALGSATGATTQLTEAAKELQDELKLLETATKDYFSQLKDEEKASFEATKEAYKTIRDEQKKQSDERIENLQKEKEASKTTFDDQIKNIQRARDAGKLAHDERIKQIDLEKKKVEEAYAKRVAEISAISEKQRASHEAHMARIDAEVQRLNTIYDAQIAKIQQVDAAQQAASNKRIADLEQQKQAIIDADAAQQEAARKQQELADLKKQATQGATAEERAAAQQKLADIAAEEKREAEKQAKIDAVNKLIAEEQARRAEEERKNKEAQDKAELERKFFLEQQEIRRANVNAANEKKLAEIKKLNDEAELERKTKLEELEQQAARLKEEQKKKELEYDKEIDTLKEQSKLKELEYDKKIAEEKAKDKRDQEAYDAAVRKLEKEHKAQMKYLEEEEKKRLDEIKKKQNEVLKVLGEKTKEAKDYATQVERAEAAQRRLNDLIAKQPKRGANKFAGGSVSGGTTYTVNELGQEGFLTRSGVLSAIDAPAWGQWKAPGAGTVIPAHIMAGLNVPKGGVPVNAVAGGNTDGSSGLLGALRGALSGNVSRVTNNVTISSDKPVTDASRMMVEMSKMRLRKR